MPCAQRCRTRAWLRSEPPCLSYDAPHAAHHTHTLADSHPMAALVQVQDPLYELPRPAQRGSTPKIG